MIILRSFIVLSRNTSRLKSFRKVTTLSSSPTLCCSCSRPSCSIQSKFQTKTQICQKKNYFLYSCARNGSFAASKEQQQLKESTMDESLLSFRSKVSEKNKVVAEDFVKITSELSKENLKDENLCSYLLQCCKDFVPSLCMKEKAELAIKIWTDFKNLDYNFKLKDFHAMLNIFEATRQPVPHSLLETSLNSTLFEERESQLRLLQCAAEIGDLRKIAEILGLMKQQGFPVKEDVFAALILGHGRARDYSSVQSVLNTMTDTAVLPGQATFLSLLKAQIENNQPIVSTLKQIEAQSIKFSENHIISLIWSVAFYNRDDLIDKVMNITSIETTSPQLKNCAIQLIHEGYAKLAVKLIYSSTNAFGKSESPTTFLCFYPKELVAANQNTEDILSICKTLQDKFTSHYSLLHVATEASLRDQSKTIMSRQLLHHIKPMRIHYFWPLTVRTRDINTMASLINSMQDLGLRVDFDTLAFYVFPHILQQRPPLELIQHFQKNCNLSVSTLLGPMLHALLSAKLLEQAVVLCKQYRSRTLDQTRLAKPLTSVTLTTLDFASSAQLLSMLAKSRHVTLKPVDMVGVFLIDFSAKCKPADLEKMLKLIQEERLSISVSSYEHLSSRSNIQQSSIQILDTITNSTVEGSSNMNQLPHPREMDLEELEAHLVELKAKNMNARGTLRRLLQIHCRLNNMTRACQIKKELDAEGYNLSPGILASMFGLYIQNKDCPNATSILDQLASQHPSFKVDEHKIIDLCTLKIQQGSAESDIRQILEHYATRMSQHGPGVRSSVSYLRNCETLLNTARERLGLKESNVILECLKTLKFL